MVGRSLVYRWMAAARDEGRRAPCLPFHAQCAWNLWQSRPRGWVAARSRSSATETEAALCRLLAANNHLRLAECRDQLAAETGVRVNPWTIGRALRRLDWT